MDFAMLADRTEAVPRIAGWYFDQWGRADGIPNAEHIEAKLQSYLNRDEMPLMVLAIAEDEILGVVQLKFREMDIYPEKEHWLGGVYVPAQHRGRDIATMLVHQALRLARALGVEQLHLQTEKLDGGLYARLGWVPQERVTYHGNEVLVMEKHLVDGDGSPSTNPSAGSL